VLFRSGLGTSAVNGQWQTFTRDLQADLEQAQPGVKILEVNNFQIRGSGLVDDIKLGCGLSPN
jgi:putative surface-exposed virulence protein